MDKKSTKAETEVNNEAPKTETKKPTPKKKPTPAAASAAPTPAKKSSSKWWQWTGIGAIGAACVVVGYCVTYTAIKTFTSSEK